jgi:predicted permease
MTRIRYAFRTLGKTPMVTLVVVLSLGLGIGANTAIFSLLDQVILRSLPVERPDELVVLHTPAAAKTGYMSSDNSGGGDSIFSYRIFREIEKRPEGLTAVAGFRGVNQNLGFRSQTVNGSALLVSGSYFATLGVKPLFGRLISPEDDGQAAGNAVAVLGYGYWQDRLGGIYDALNQPLRVNGQLFTIIGVAPKGFTSTTLGAVPDVYLPISFRTQLTPGRNISLNYNDHWVYLFGRLKPGMTRTQAEAGLNTVYAGLKEEQAKATTGQSSDFIKRLLQSKLSLVEGRQGQSSLRDTNRTPLYILMAATGLVLLIAMANAANLLLARSAQRRREMAIRTALGASRSAIMGQLLIEALLLSAAGGLAGILFAVSTLRLLIAHLVGGDGPVYFLTASLDWRTLLFSLAISMLTGLLFGLHPAWEAARSSVLSGLNDDSGKASSSHGAARARKLLVCAQVAISALLLVPTGLFLKSLVNLLHVDLGLRTEKLVTFRISPQLNSYKPEQSRALIERAEEQVAAIPGVRDVAASSISLIAGNNSGGNITVEGFAQGPGADTHSMLTQVGAGFFRKMGIPLIAGREFTDTDNLGSPKVAVVNEAFVRHFIPSGNPLGRKFCPGAGTVTPDIEIVGVAKDAKYSSVKQAPPVVYYTPWRQNKVTGAMTFYVRTGIDPAQTIPQIRNLMSSIDHDLPVENLRTLEDQVQRMIRPDRLVLQLAAAFAILATLMAMLGLYGVMAYSVTRRTREIGIRLALGAGATRIRGMMMRELLVILAVGLAMGIPAALALARLTESQLFGVKSQDAMVVATAVSALALASLLAGYFPARRATRVNPVEALRHE